MDKQILAIIAVGVVITVLAAYLLNVSPPTISSKKKREPTPIAMTIIPIIPRIDLFFFSDFNNRFIQQILLKDNLKNW